MKRSEAIDKILNKLWIYGVPDLSREDAEKFLDFVENDLKMLPPMDRVDVKSDPIFLLEWEQE